MKRILYIINIVFALALLLTYIPGYLPADIFPKISLIGYCYPFLLVINIAFIIVWLILKPRYIIFPLLVILIKFSFITSLFNYSETTDDGELKVLTYNLKNFSHKIDNYDKELIKRQQDSILDYISSLNADIVCFQDYSCSTKQKQDFHYQMTHALGFNHIYSYNINDGYIQNCAIYSKYPIIDGGSVLSDNPQNYAFIYADIRTQNKTVRVYNLHLASYMLGDKEKSDYNKIIKGHISDTAASKNILTKLADANKRRTAQIKSILPAVSSNQKAVIVTGDFNDHPFSYTYRQMTKNLSDSFKEKGKYIGRTYNGEFPAYRIDYILFDKNRLDCKSYYSPALDFSDHYPVFSTFNFKDE